MIRGTGAARGSIDACSALALVALAGAAGAAVAQTGTHGSYEPARPAGVAPGEPQAARFHAVPGLRETTDRLLVRLAPDVTDADLAARDLAVIGGVPELGLTTLRVAPGDDPEAVADRLLASGLAAEADMDYRVFPIQSDELPDPLTEGQWHLGRIGAPAAWAYSVGSRDVTLAFIDSGVDLDHTELAPLLVPGYNAASQQAQAAGGNLNDTTGHGTATAGAAAAIGNNGFGGAGVGWAFDVMPVRASNTQGGAAFITDILNGGTWAINNGADVVSVSYAGVEQAFVEGFGAFARANDALVVWGIDDAGLFRAFDHPSVLVVSGTTPNDELASFSSFGPGVDIAAPATSLNLPHSNGGYRVVAGNSYATPLVAAAAGIARAVNPQLSIDEIEQIILDTAEDLGTPGEDDQFGAGLLRVDAVAAAALAAAGQPAGFNEPVDAIERLGDGLAVGFYDLPPGADTLPNFASSDAFDRAVVTSLDLEASHDAGFAGSALTTNFGAVFAGYFDAPADRLYTFELRADTDARLTISNTVVADTEANDDSGVIGLARGLHPLFIEFYAAQGETAELEVTVATPTSPTAILAADRLRFILATADMNGDGAINLTDFAIFVDAWSQGDPIADIDGNGLVELSDVSVYLSAWALGI